jgi:hypothetical protein
MVIVSPVRFTYDIYICVQSQFLILSTIGNSCLCSILHTAFGKEIILIIGYSTNAGYVFRAHISEVGDR